MRFRALERFDVGALFYVRYRTIRREVLPTRPSTGASFLTNALSSPTDRNHARPSGSVVQIIPEARAQDERDLRTDETDILVKIIIALDGHGWTSLTYLRAGTPHSGRSGVVSPLL